MVRILLEPIIRSIASCFSAMAYKLKIAFVLCNRSHGATEPGSVEKLPQGISMKLGLEKF